MTYRTLATALINLIELEHQNNIQHFMPNKILSNKLKSLLSC